MGTLGVRRPTVDSSVASKSGCVSCGNVGGRGAWGKSYGSSKALARARAVTKSDVSATTTTAVRDMGARMLPCAADDPVSAYPAARAVVHRVGGAVDPGCVRLR